jgi:hypothetical protein
MEKYYELVGRIEKEIEKCMERQRESKENADFQREHMNIVFAELLRGILDDVVDKHYR